MKRFLFLAFIMGIFAVTSFTGCISSSTERIVYTRPDPPSPQVEVITVAPYQGAVWEKGYWVWHPRHRRYVWTPGHWRAQ